MKQTPAQPHPQTPRLLLPCAVIFVAALALRLAYALPRPVPVSVDAAYYLMVAENIYHGRGLVSDYVWNYLAGLPGALPVPSNEYWMPGTSFVTAAAFALADSTSLRVAQMPSLILGALLCAITAWMGGLLFRRRDVAFLSGALTVISFRLVGLALHPDHFMLAAVLVNLSLLALWASLQGPPLWALAAGFTAALAYLTRTDGALLVAVAFLMAVGLLRRAQHRRALLILACFLLAFALTAAPWWVRQTMAFGHPSGANPLRTAFLTDYNDLFRLDQSSLNLRDYLQTSQRFALLFKGYALFWALRLLAKATLLIGLLALAAVGFPRFRSQARPWLIYLVLATLAPALLVPYPALKGGFWHLFAGVCPILFVLGAAMALHLLELAKRMRLRPLRLLPRFAVAVCLLSLLHWWVLPPGDAKEWHSVLYPPIALDAVRALGPNPPPVLADNAWGLYYTARIPCAQFPTDGAGPALRVADSIGARYFITRFPAEPDDPLPIPAIVELVRRGHPRFAPLHHYRIQQGWLLIYRILPPEQAPD